jgi:hypothetical protein
MEKSKYLNQSLLILVISICVIILLIMYSYKHKFSDSAMEGFETETDNANNGDNAVDTANNAGDTNNSENADVSEISTTTTEKTLISNITEDEIDELNTLSNQLSNINILKSQIYNNYSDDTVINYQDVLKLNPEVFKFDNVNYSLNFYQSLQNQEIKDLQSNYDKLKTELSNIPTNINQKVNKIKHIASGTVFTVNNNPMLNNSDFNIILDLDKSMCLEFKSLDADYIKTLPVATEVNNINRVACDYGSQGNSNYINETIKKQKFKAVKISNNSDYNKNLHSIYELYKIPDINENNDNGTDYYNTLNNYPYYLIKPMYSADSNMCLTLTNGMLSVEPCDGSDKQKFELLELNY